MVQLDRDAETATYQVLSESIIPECNNKFFEINTARTILIKDSKDSLSKFISLQIKKSQ